MKKVHLLCVMLFSACNIGFAQTATNVATASKTETVHWVDSTANNAKMLNKSKFGDNWFLGFHLGSFHSWGSHTSGSDFFKQFRPATAISVGKWVAPAGGFRIQAALGSNRAESENGQKYNWGTFAGYVDGLFNMTNIFCGYKENRKFNLIALVGAGVERTFGFSDKSWNSEIFDDEGCTSVTLRAGLMARIQLNKALDLNIEAVNNWIDDSYDGQYTNNRYDGHVNVLVGLTYRFKNHDGSHHFTYATKDITKYDALNDELNRARAEANKVIEPEIIIKKEVEKSNQVHTMISFEKGKTTINKLQQVNVYTTAQAWAQHSNAVIYITMNEEAVNTDVEQFQARAESIRKMLVNDFQVPAASVNIVQDPSKINTVDPDKTFVLMFINQ